MVQPPPCTHILDDAATAAPRPSREIDASGREGAAPARGDGVIAGTGRAEGLKGEWGKGPATH